MRSTRLRFLGPIVLAGIGSFAACAPKNGPVADLVVLDKNLLEMPAEKIGTAKVILTLFEGCEAGSERFP